jgi:hypothetical protein
MFYLIVLQALHDKLADKGSSQMFSMGQIIDDVILPSQQRLQAPPFVLTCVGEPPRSFPLIQKQAGRYILASLNLVTLADTLIS